MRGRSAHISRSFRKSNGVAHQYIDTPYGHKLVEVRGHDEEAVYALINKHFGAPEPAAVNDASAAVSGGPPEFLWDTVPVYIHVGKNAGFDEREMTGGMTNFLSRMGVLLKDFGGYVHWTSERLKEASSEMARRLERPIQYLPSAATRKETVARQIAQRDGIREGLICVLSCVEPCRSYEVHRDRKIKKLVLEPRLRKCLHLYHYWIDPFVGFMHARIQSWFPFQIRVCLNGREWLARQMDRQGMAYQRRENCFLASRTFPGRKS